MGITATGHGYPDDQMQKKTVENVPALGPFELGSIL